MGEEHGEAAPFQFFSDHIDEEIAVATREGRRREFAGFAEFAGEEVPDPQDPETFRRSKLTRTGEPEGLRDLYARLLAFAPRDRPRRGRGRLRRARGLADRSAAASISCSPTSASSRCTCRSTARSSCCSPRTTRRSSPATSSCPPLAGALLR